MTDTDKQLLENVFDSLDRLFDQESKLIDIYQLLFATRPALSNAPDNPNLTPYIEELHVLVRSGLHGEIEREKALEITNPLRIVLNDLLPIP